MDWVAVDVAKLLDAFSLRKDVEVVVAREPEGILGEFLRDRTFDNGRGHAQGFERRFREKKVNVFGHYDVAEDREVVSFADGLQGV
jgi:hypothetical protein